VAICVLLGVGIVDRTHLFTLLSPLLLGVGAASFILGLVHGAPEAKRFGGPRLAFFGQISYALYLFHQPINGALHGLILGSRPDVGTPSQVAVTARARNRS
jgi:peptidoglycan/LPS O-acetylase OafA/YrhL